MITILSVSWKRLRLTKLTLRSLNNAISARDDLVSATYILDQNSGSRQVNWLRKFITERNGRVISKPSNVGIAKAWAELLKLVNTEFVMLLENDWFCDSDSATFISDALKILSKHNDVGFVKMRSLRDRDDWGRHSTEHSPWNFPDQEGTLFVQAEIGNLEYFVCIPQGTSFTLNPILARRTFLESLADNFIDNPLSTTPLKSGEDLPDAAWRGQRDWKAAVLKDGPFRHIGFIRKRDKYLTLHTYRLKFYCRLLVHWFQKVKI